MELLRLIKIVKTFLFKTHSVSLNRKRLMKENLKELSHGKTSITTVESL